MPVDFDPSDDDHPWYKQFHDIDLQRSLLGDSNQNDEPIDKLAARLLGTPRSLEKTIEEYNIPIAPHLARKELSEAYIVQCCKCRTWITVLEVTGTNTYDSCVKIF